MLSKFRGLQATRALDVQPVVEQLDTGVIATGRGRAMAGRIDDGLQPGRLWHEELSRPNRPLRPVGLTEPDHPILRSLARGETIKDHIPATACRWSRSTDASPSRPASGSAWDMALDELRRIEFDVERDWPATLVIVREDLWNEPQVLTIPPDHFEVVGAALAYIGRHLYLHSTETPDRRLPPDVRRIGRTWWSRASFALEVLRFFGREDMSSTVRAVEARRLVDSLIHRITAEGMPIANLDTTVGEFAGALDRWVVDLTYWLRLPSRT